MFLPMTMQESFTAEIVAFLAKHDLEPATFGRQALNDPNFVSDLRAGRSPNLRTIERVREFIDSYPASKERRADQASNAGAIP